jgi:hypothetical protein
VAREPSDLRHRAHWYRKPFHRVGQVADRSGLMAPRSRTSRQAAAPCAAVEGYRLVEAEPIRPCRGARLLPKVSAWSNLDLGTGVNVLKMPARFSFGRSSGLAPSRAGFQASA